MQQFASQKLTVPFVQYSHGRFLGDISDSPEVSLFGKDYLGTNNLVCLKGYNGPFPDTCIIPCEIASSSDVPVVLQHISQINSFKLMDAYQIQEADFLTIPDGTSLREAALGAFKIPYDTVPPWYFRNWVVSARSWIVQRLQARFSVVPESVELAVVKSWEIGYVAQVRGVTETGEPGIWWFKASPSRLFSSEHTASVWEASLKFMFCEETFLTSHPLLRSVTPPVIAIDRDRGWMIIEDGGRQMACAKVPRAPKDEFASRFVELQKLTAGQCDLLLEMGLPDRRLEKMVPLLRNALDKATIADLPDFSLYYKRLEERVRIVEQYSGPYAAVLVHSDMHQGNLLFDEKTGTVNIIDWSDGCVAHPLIDFTSLMSRRHPPEAMYLSTFGFPERARKDAVLLERVHAIVSYCCVFESVQESDELEWTAQYVRQNIMSTITLLSE